VTHRATPTALLEAWGVIATPYRFTPNGEELIALDFAARGWRMLYDAAMTVRHIPSAARDAEARAAMTEARRLGTLDAMLFYHEGMIDRALGENARARYFLTKALELNPKFHPTQPREIRAVLDSIDRESSRQ